VLLRERINIGVLWVISRIVLLGAAAIASWSALSGGSFGSAYVELWNRWDSRWFESIAVSGYVGPTVSAFEDFQYNVAFFPGLPGIMWAGESVGIPATLTGLIVSFVAGYFAALAVGRLTKFAGGQALWGVLAWVLAPTAVFITAAYTEALFAAFAFWAWAYAIQRKWVLAGLLAGIAGIVRPNGLFLAAGLIVLFVLSGTWKTSHKEWLRGSALLLPLVSAFGYISYLRAITGDWTTWSAAQGEFWERHLVDPVTALVNTYNLIFTFSPTGEPSSRMVTEILAMAIMVAVVVVCAWKRSWAEVVYVGFTALSLGTSTMYYSVPRTLVLIFPLWTLLGVFLTRHVWARWAFVVLSVPALLLVTIRFTQGQWIS